MIPVVVVYIQLVPMFSVQILIKPGFLILIFKANCSSPIGMIQSF